jgi:DNA-binding NarL/FixJ family response regulator
MLQLVSRPANREDREACAEPVRVVIADNHPFSRQGLAKLLRESGIDVLGEAPSGLALLEVVERTRPDVAVMHVHDTGPSELEVIRHLTGRTSSCRVLVLSESAKEADASAAIVAGATGYLLEDAPVGEVVMGIRAAATGESLISPRVAPMLLRSMGAPVRVEPALRPLGLSRRELDVLTLIADGKGNREIGDALLIGAGTVRNHVSRVLKKLDVDNRVQAAVRAVREHMV